MDVRLIQADDWEGIYVDGKISNSKSYSLIV